MTNDERDELLLEIRGMLKGLEKDIGRHEKTLYGNGQPGLCQQVQELKDYQKNENGFWRRFGAVAAWLVTTVIAIYSAVKHH